MKISPGKRADLEITATVDKPGLDICSIRVAAAGTHLPCVIDDLANKTYAPQTASLDLDIVTNFGETKFAAGGAMVKYAFCANCACTCGASELYWESVCHHIHPIHFVSIRNMHITKRDIKYDTSSLSDLIDIIRRNYA